jgi:hypothetical protein
MKTYENRCNCATKAVASDEVFRSPVGDVRDLRNDKSIPICTVPRTPIRW